MNKFVIVELMGHVRMAGYVTEEEHFGVKLARIDIAFEGHVGTVYFNAANIYRLTPCTAETANLVASTSDPLPVGAFDVPARPGWVDLSRLTVEQWATELERRQVDKARLVTDDDSDPFAE